MTGARNDRFLAGWDQIQSDIHNTAIDKGWWENERNQGELLALVHSEVSEALESLRKDNPPDDKIPEFTGVEAELADVVIRIMDMAEAFQWDVAGAIIAKMEMNKGRAYKHGKKF